ncbi:hypothetical protein [Enhydrobacter sp.]|jgi:hypothetical protein|uniref:hypothetical protein n=1 Tax=Enhydrobacter sp. TaxID=1894999 RepID=UPI0026146942|nr:hypothetical protein [Enhydrobacter sp.]WIM11819.1 MAG: hypothetical protein OJF58_002778 [Enhydrobacter sp.]
MTSSRYRNTAFEKGRPSPVLATEPGASARLMLRRREAAGLAHDLAHWTTVRSRRGPVERSWAAMRRSPQLLDEPKPHRP